MNTNELKQKSKHLVNTNMGILVSLAIVSSVVSVAALRANNEHMVKLRNEVFVADKNDVNVTGTLQNLQAYVTTHMNTNLNGGNGSVYPPIQLKYTYQRLLDNESSQAAASNSSLYTDAQNYCQQAVPTGFSGRYRVPCIEQYVESHDTSLATVSTSLYEFDFVSPSWSPDLAGWSLAVAVISWIIILATVVGGQLRKLFEI
jgi:hypothetical protein